MELFYVFSNNGRVGQMRNWLWLLLLRLFFIDFVSGCGVIDVRGTFKHTTTVDAVVVGDVAVFT